MKQRISNIKRPKLLALSFLLLAFLGCKKTDKFYDTLKALPQINYGLQYAYRTAYVVGDTMMITGKLQPDNNLQITIGGVPASIISTVTVGIGSGTVGGPAATSDKHQDQVSFLITQEMAGKAQEVKVTTGGYSVLGSAIDVYTSGGEGSFSSSLSSVKISTISSAYQFLYCVNGKGDVYYYSATSKHINHIYKDGSEELLLDLSGNISQGNFTVNTFLAGGVDPNGNFLYFSVRTTDGYRFCSLNLKNGALTTLNQSNEIAAPYEGALNTVKMIVTGIYPDANGNLYLGMDRNSGNIPYALARYDKATGLLAYVYKGLNDPFGQQSYPGMPGITFAPANFLVDFRISPNESLLYALETNATRNGIAIELFDLSARIKVQDFATSNNNTTGGTAQYTVIAPFSGLHIDMGAPGDVNRNFGFLPMPGRRLQIMLFQNFGQAADFGFPKWIVFDFVSQRTYAYAPGKFQLGDFGQYSLRNTDELLNYDEAGNLYMSASGKSYLVKTAAQ